MKPGRADALLHHQGIAPSRSAARRLIISGQVEQHTAQGWQVLAKPSQKLAADTRLRVTDDSELRFASRGGLKLSHALSRTGMVVKGLTVLDVGQSSGGFTDCLLQAGAHHVVGIDTGHGQLTEALKLDARVTCLERINARELPQTLPLQTIPDGGFPRVVMDVSFISQTLIIEPLLSVMAPGAQILALVKPQFEVGRENVGKGGLIRDPALHKLTQSRVIAHYRSLGLEQLDYFDSPIAGGEGNREFFIYARLPG